MRSATHSSPDSEWCLCRLHQCAALDSRLHRLQLYCKRLPNINNVIYEAIWLPLHAWSEVDFETHPSVGHELPSWSKSNVQCFLPCRGWVPQHSVSGWLILTHTEWGAEPGLGCFAHTQGTRKLSHAHTDTCAEVCFQLSCGDTSNSTSESFGWSLLSSPLCICVFLPHVIKTVSERPSAGICDMLEPGVCAVVEKGLTRGSPACMRHCASPLALFPEHHLPSCWHTKSQATTQREHSALLCVCSWKQLAEHKD